MGRPKMFTDEERKQRAKDSAKRSLEKKRLARQDVVIEPITQQEPSELSEPIELVETEIDTSMDFHVPFDVARAILHPGMKSYE